MVQLARMELMEMLAHRVQEENRENQVLRVQPVRKENRESQEYATLQVLA